MTTRLITLLGMFHRPVTSPVTLRYLLRLQREVFKSVAFVSGSRSRCSDVRNLLPLLRRDDPGTARRLDSSRRFRVESRPEILVSVREESG